MNARARQAVQCFIDRAALPANSYALLARHEGKRMHLHVWLDRAVLHTVEHLPKTICGVPVSVEVRPRVIAFNPKSARRNP